jgi:DNA-binding transcriptional LysR family regulator
MEIRKLEIFEAVARHASFSRAAEELHLAQPAVSIAVRKLEEELGVRLLDRRGRRALLTAEGEEALVRGRGILAAARDLRNHMQEMRGLARGELTVACPSMLATYYLPDLLTPFLTRYPGVSATVIQAGTQRIEQMILDDAVELGVVTMKQNNAELEITPLIDEEMVVCVGSNHPWSRRKYLRVTDLDAVPMVLYERDYFVRQALEEVCEQAGIAPDIRLETNFLPLISRMVKQSVGVTVALSMMADHEPDLRGIRLRPAIKFSMGIARRKGRSLSRANHAFLGWLTGESGQSDGMSGHVEVEDSSPL